MSQLPTRVVIRNSEGVEVDRGRWLASSAAGISIVSDASRDDWFTDYDYPKYSRKFESDEFPNAFARGSRS